MAPFSSKRTYSLLMVFPSSESVLMITWDTRPFRLFEILVVRSLTISTAVSAPSRPVTEKQIILAALEANDWNRQKTADQLQINRTTLYKKIKQYDLEEYGRTA